METKTIKSLFEYNWKIREKWFEWSKEISVEELIKARNGGYKGILKTLFHIVDVEQRWITGLSKVEPQTYSFADYNTLEKIMKFSNKVKKDSLIFLDNYSKKRNNDVLTAENKKGENVSHLYIEIILHLSVHEVHHMGQLSVWAREIGKEPVSANLIGLNLFNNTIDSY
jgi:uncharacterized damage-inducible protein DinB